MELSYKLVFEDNFDGAVLNPNLWQTFYPWGRSLHSEKTTTGWERQYYTDENVSVSDGYLNLNTKVDPGYRSPESGTNNIFFNFTSGMVFSVPKFTKGKFEIRCKIPVINGMFPAFWLFGYCFQEIDIFEFTNSSETSDPSIDGGNLITTYHRQFDCSDPEKGICHHGLSRNFGKNLSEDFHNYSLEWNEYKIVWKLDGSVVREVYRYWVTSPSESLYGYAYPVKSCKELQFGNSYQVFEPFPILTNALHLIINSAVLKERAGDPGALPQQFLVDYVRAYEEIESDSIINSNYNFSVFPNPNTGIFSFPRLINGKAILNINVINVLGNNVEFTQEMKDDLIYVSLVNKVQGVYYLRVETEERQYLCKFVVT